MSQKNVAGEDITEGAVIPEGGDKTTLTIPAGETTNTAQFGDIRFDKAGTYTFLVTEDVPSEQDPAGEDERPRRGGAER